MSRYLFSTWCMKRRGFFGLTVHRNIWPYCQSHSFLRLTANRNQDDSDSEDTILGSCIIAMIRYHDVLACDSIHD